MSDSRFGEAESDIMTIHDEDEECCGECGFYLPGHASTCEFGDGGGCGYAAPTVHGPLS